MFKNEPRVLSEFVSKTANATGAKALEKLFADALLVHGYDSFTYFNCLAHNGLMPGVICNTISEKWWDHYECHRFENHDPVLHGLAHATAPFHVDDLIEHAGGKGRQCLADAKIFGLRNLVAIPIRGGDGNFHAVLVSGRSERAFLGVLAELQQMSLVFHQVYARLLPNSVSSVELTPRQKVYLSGIAKGQTIAEVARSNGVSPVTVRDRLEAAYQRLGVTNLQGAVARSIACNLMLPQLHEEFTDEVIRVL